MNLEDLERRVRTLEDIEEDAIWDGRMRGRADGREAIRDFFLRAAQRLPFALHMVMNPVIEVNGDTASGTWYLFQPCTFAEGEQAVWGSARYDEEYAKIDGIWMFTHLKLTSFFWTPFDQGWVRKRFA